MSLENLTSRLSVAILLMATPTLAVDGTFTATESWSVTLDYSNWGDSYTGTQHFSGTQSGTIVIVDGNYTLLDRSGVAWASPGLDLKSRSISGDATSYRISGNYIFGPGFSRGIVFLGAFVVSVPLVVGEPPLFYRFDTYSGYGTDLSFISGGGDMIAEDLTVTVSSTLSLRKVVGPPTIVTQPTNETIFAGQDARFSVLAAGDGPLSYTWRKNGVTLPSENLNWLTLTNVQISDAGGYSVVISNTGGKVTSVTAALSVKQPPLPWVEGWESASPGVYVPSGNSTTAIAADQGWWIVGDTISLFPDCGPTQNHADILLENGRKSLSLVSAASPSDCAQNIGVSIDRRTSSSFPIPIVRSSEISFTEQGFMVNPTWNGLFGCIFPPCGDTTALSISDNLDNVVVYIFQRATNYVEHFQTNGLSNSGYREIFLDPGGGTFTRNLYDDLESIAGTVGVGASIEEVGFSIASEGWATLDDLRIGPQAAAVDTLKPVMALSAPVSGQRLTNGIATLQGTASDNAQVADVFYQVNSAGWSPASSTNGWKKWSQTVPLTAGTNVIQVYAVDVNGNTSATNRVSVFYVVKAPLLVGFSGKGTITPNYNGQFLEIGRNYTMTATPAAGFGFTKWTGSIETNRAALTFLMTSNLGFTANFMDTQKPTVTITTPLANQRLTNMLFTLLGKAADNVQVTQVVYRVNGDEWAPALSTNAWTNWTAGITLTPGTNTLRAYALDSTGNASVTSSVASFYVVKTPLTVQIKGKGAVSPNYDGQVLEIGRNYTMTATPGAGYAFTNWTGSQTTNKPPLTFLMTSNLSFTANFIDAQRPTLSITTPVANQRLSNALFTVTGKAGDNTQVTGVVYRANSDAWTLASSTNGWTNWSADVTLIPGTNVVRACALDIAGNLSLTGSVACFYVLRTPLSVQVNGKGTITPNYNGQLLEIGRNYTITATAGTGFVFTNWFGSLPTNKPALTFVMASNLAFTANFVDIARPAVAITAPAAGQHWTNAAFTVRGKATDNGPVAQVFYQLNSNDWAIASSTNGWTNWTAEVTLTSRTNLVRAYAQDNAGNKSLTNSVSFVYIFGASNAPLLTQSIHLTLSLERNQANLRLVGDSGTRYVIQSSPDLLEWSDLVTVIPAAGVAQTNQPASSRRMFYRAIKTR